jgi:hypothetical protein
VNKGKRAVIALCLVASILGGTTGCEDPSNGGKDPVGAQVVSDLVGAGVSVGAALSGSVPVAFLAGYISKYVSTYGVAGIKSVVDYVKGYGPRDISEANLLYIYLLNVKRNLYQTMITIRKSVEADDSISYLTAELDKAQQSLTCVDKEGCDEGSIDSRYVDLNFLNLILDAKQSIRVTQYLGANEIKNTYQYLVLLYLDVVILEQKLIEAQSQILADRSVETLKLLKGNPYLSNEEKEYQAQMLMNLVLRWMKLADSRRAVVAQAIAKPLSDLESQNADLEREIARYHHEHEKTLFSKSLGTDGDYEGYLHRIQDEIDSNRMSMDPFAQNPFQTGTALSNYYLSEKTLLLERDAFFQMKANQLKTTDDVADYQHRVQVLRSQANNMMIQLAQAIEQRNSEGFSSVEGPKTEEALEQIVADCNKDASCVAERLNNPETSLKSILIDNFKMSTMIFRQMPQMHVLEANAVYQLIQLVYLEVLYSQNVLSRVEFDLFNAKQVAVAKAVRANTALTGAERAYEIALIKNTVDTWKKRILERRYDHGEEFKAQALSLTKENQGLLASIEQNRKAHPEIYGESAFLDGEQDGCFFLAPRKGRRECQSQRDLLRSLRDLQDSKPEFLNGSEQKLPDEFWREL